MLYVGIVSATPVFTWHTHGAWVFVWAAAGVSECIQEHPGIIFQRCSNFTSVYELCGEQPVSHTIIINLGAHSEEELREGRQLHA